MEDPEEEKRLMSPPHHRLLASDDDDGKEKRRISVFERLSQPEARATKRIVADGRISVVAANPTFLPTGLSAPGKNTSEASSSGGKLTRRQRRKMNAELRAQQLLVPVHPSNLPAPEHIANVPTRNKFTDLRWVKRNSPTGELKKSFWDQQSEVPAPSRKKEPETLSARVYRVLKTVKEKGLKKRRFQRPLTIEARRTPPRERLSSDLIAERRRRQKQISSGEHRGVTPEPRVQGSTAERSRQKGKQIWRPRPHREEKNERRTDLGVTSGAASRRSAPVSKQHQKWVQKKTHDDANPDGRHLGESSRGSRRAPTPPKNESNFDRSPQIEEIFLPSQEPEIQWRRRSEIRVLEEEEEEDMGEEYIEDMEEENIEEYIEENLEEMNNTLDMEVVYMVRHVNVDDEAYYDDGEGDDRWQPPVRQVYRRHHEAGSTTGGGGHSQGEDEVEEVEGNPPDAENITLADMRRQMRRQMRAKDREISQLNEKMTEMMTQMAMMMQMMQRNAAVGPMPNPPPDPPNFQAPQVSGVRGAPEGGNEVHNITRQPTPQNIASTSEPVTAAQLEGIITEKIKAIIAVDQAERLVGKGRPYPAEYDQVQYPKGSSVPKFNTLNGNNNPRQHLAQFKATCGNTGAGGNDALLFRQFVSSLTGTAFEWYAELPNDSVKTFAELESMFVKRFASATEKITIADLALDKRKREESVTKYITRWRNLSMKCEQQLEEEHAVQL